MKRYSSFLLITAVLFLAFGATAAMAQEGGGADPGSLLVFPYWDNSGTLRTLFRITNTGGTFPVGAPAYAAVNVPVHIIFVTAEEFGCGEWNTVIRLTKKEATQINTKAFIQSGTIKEMNGFAVIYVGDGGRKWCWDHLVGDWFVIDTNSGNIIGNQAFPYHGVTWDHTGGPPPSPDDPFCLFECDPPEWDGAGGVVVGGELGTPVDHDGPGDDEILRFCNPAQGHGGVPCLNRSPAGDRWYPEYSLRMYDAPSEFYVQYNTRFRKIGFLPVGANKTDATRVIFLPWMRPTLEVGPPPQDPDDTICRTFNATEQKKLCYCYDLVIFNAFEQQNSLPNRRACCWVMETLADLSDEVSTQKSFYKSGGERANYGWLYIYPERTCETDINFQLGGFRNTHHAILYQLEGIRPTGEWSLYTAHNSTLYLEP